MKKSFKKYVSLIAVLTLFCTGMTAALAMPNPLHESSVEDQIENVGIALEAPKFANSASWFRIDTEPAMSELRFTADGIEYCYRAQAVNEFTDISGLYVTWNAIDDKDVKVLYEDARLCLSSEGAGILQWYAVVPGVMYSLSASEGATEDNLQDVANRIYKPLQGEADGQVTE